MSSIANLQQSEPDLRLIFDNLQDKLPLSQKAARKTILEASDYLIADGTLIHTRVYKAKWTKSLISYQLVIPQTLIKTVKKKQ